MNALREDIARVIDPDAFGHVVYIDDLKWIAEVVQRKQLAKTPKLMTIDIFTAMAQAAHEAKCTAYARRSTITFATIEQIEREAQRAALECFVDNLPSECINATTAISEKGKRKPFREELRAAVGQAIGFEQWGG